MEVNYFDLLGVEKIFSLDLEVLEKNYLNLQKTHHPDKAANPAEKEYFLKLSSSINVAYKTLVNDLTRAEYLLSLNGLYLQDCKSKDLQHIFLEMIESNETLQNISDNEGLRNFLLKQQENRKDALLQMNQSFLKQDLGRFLIDTSHLKYLEKIISQAKKMSF